MDGNVNGHTGDLVQLPVPLQWMRVKASLTQPAPESTLSLHRGQHSMCMVEGRTTDLQTLGMGPIMAQIQNTFSHWGVVHMIWEV